MRVCLVFLLLHFFLRTNFCVDVRSSSFERNHEHSSPIIVLRGYLLATLVSGGFLVPKSYTCCYLNRTTSGSQKGGDKAGGEEGGSGGRVNRW